MVVGALTFVTGMLALVVVLMAAWPTPPVEARLNIVARANRPSGQIAVTVANRTDSLLEAIARLSDAHGHPTRYETRGGSAFLVETLGQGNDDYGRWQVLVNERLVEDLAAVTLQAGDELQLNRMILQ